MNYEKLVEEVRDEMFKRMCTVFITSIASETSEKETDTHFLTGMKDLRNGCKRLLKLCEEAEGKAGRR